MTANDPSPNHLQLTGRSVAAFPHPGWPGPRTAYGHPRHRRLVHRSRRAAIRKCPCCRAARWLTCSSNPVHTRRPRAGGQAVVRRRAEPGYQYLRHLQGRVLSDTLLGQKPWPATCLWCAIPRAARHLYYRQRDPGRGHHQRRRRPPAHPTQAMLDMLTIRQHKGGFEGLKVAIVGDVLHSRWPVPDPC